MKIIAIIPARGGSKGIPNKNIRIICGHPLIYYTIKNAIQSEYISDVLVTTDSDEVEIIARQMGVRCHRREDILCGDEITLDAVIFDALPRGERWDYVITMQPTSPTLKASTLDAAIRHTVKYGYDTIISAINEPHLTWGKNEKGEIKPNYAVRLNRQYLPPCYKETGAFFISKASVITPESRLGNKIGIFEVAEEESVDVDTFIDLKAASSILENQKVAIYVNGNNKRGMGHVYRALDIADEFYTKPDIYYDFNQTDRLVFGKTTHNLIPVNGIAELFDCCKIKKYTIFINDILATSIDYMIALRNVLPNAKIINFEDDGEGAIKADLVFNALYQESPFPQVKSGEKYYIPGKTFMFYEPITIREKVKNVFIAFGGADPQNYSDRLLNIIKKTEYDQFNFIVVLGRAKNNVEKLLEFNEFPNIRVLYDVANMPELMSECDIGITSRGRVGYELAMLGIPSIAISQNKREEKHGFVCDENGFTYIGLNPSDEIIEGNLKMYLNLSKDTRCKLHDELVSHDLRGGRKRVMSLINALI